MPSHLLEQLVSAQDTQHYRDLTWEGCCYYSFYGFSNPRAGSDGAM